MSLPLYLPENPKPSSSNPGTKIEPTCAYAHHQVLHQISKRTASKRSILLGRMSEHSSITQTELPFVRAKGGTIKPVSIDWQTIRSPCQEFDPASSVGKSQPTSSLDLFNELPKGSSKKCYMALPTMPSPGPSLARPSELPTPITPILSMLREDVARYPIKTPPHPQLVSDAQQDSSIRRATIPDDIPLEAWYKGALGLYTGPEVSSSTEPNSGNTTDTMEDVEIHPPWPIEASLQHSTLPRRRFAETESLPSPPGTPSAEGTPNQRHYPYLRRTDTSALGFDSFHPKRKREGSTTSYSETQLRNTTAREEECLNIDFTQGSFTKPTHW